MTTEEKAYKDSLLRAKDTNKSEGWSEEDERIMDNCIEYIKASCLDANDLYKCIDWLKSLRSQPREEIYQSAKHDLAIKFMNYLDENRLEGKMCLSNGECEDIDKAFMENDWAKIMRYAHKYLPHWEPTDKQIAAIEESLRFYSGITDTHQHLKSLLNELIKL